MKNWTDSIINWHQLPGTEVKRLIATWGKTPADIAKYDKAHGFVVSLAPNKPAPKIKVTPQVAALPGVTPFGFKPVGKTVIVKKAAKPSKVIELKVAIRGKHTGADGEVKFVEHRNLFIGFFGGKVVVTKKTEEACLAVLRKTHNLEV